MLTMLGFYTEERQGHYHFIVKTVCSTIANARAAAQHTQLTANKSTMWPILKWAVNTLVSFAVSEFILHIIDQLGAYLFCVLSNIKLNILSLFNHPHVTLYYLLHMFLKNILAIFSI